MAAANGTGTAAMLGRVERLISRADRGRWVQLRGVSRRVGFWVSVDEVVVAEGEEIWGSYGETTAYIARFPAHFGGIWRDLAGIVAIGSCSSAADPLVRFLPPHEPIVVQFHCVIEIDFSSGEKSFFPICVFIKTQYEWSIDREQEHPCAWISLNEIYFGLQYENIVSVLAFGHK